MELKNIFKLGALAAALALAGCGGDVNIDTGGETVVPPTNPPVTQTPQEQAYSGFATQSETITAVDGKQVWVLNGTLTPSSSSSSISGTGGQNGSRIVLGNDVVWQLSGAVVAGGDNENSVDLEIQAGTKILGASESYLVVSRGSTIKAEGSESDPIIFTSVEKGIGQEGAPGQWGGLVLLGNAPVNTCPDLTDCAASFEVGNHSYGGNDEDDSSGSLKYVRVEHGGFKINDTQEMNGVSFAAVGSGTEVSHLQVHDNNDDGIEFWGGNVSVKHVVLTDNFDDSLDWTNGWTGSAQHVYIRQKQNGSNRGIEADSNSNDEVNPRSNPRLANITIEVAEGENAGGDNAEGILLRKGTGVMAHNILVKGKPASGECLEINGDNTVTHAQAGGLVFTHSLIDCARPFKSAKADADKGTTLAYDVEKWFKDQDGNLTVSADLDGYMPNPSSPLLTGGRTGLASVDPRLDNADHIGAFRNDDWTEGWTTAIHSDDAPVSTDLPRLTACPAGTTTEAVADGFYADDNVNLVCSLSGNVTANVTLLAGSNVLYKLEGGPVVIGGDNENSATLSIQAGTKIFGESGGYIAVSRGSRIMAQGNANHPIVMTSEEDVIKGATPDRRQWGGLVLLGNGLLNTCEDKDNCDASFEVGDHPYGGNDNEDSSGELSYVVVKYAGFKVNDTQEMNGISFAAVGSGTKVDHIQVHANGDDGVEFWGGAVNLKYVYLTDNFDDSLDWTNGWTGKVQYLYITHEDGNANRGIEADSNGTASAEPVSNPVLSNVTILPGAGISNGDGDGEGILLRKATAGALHNVLIQGRSRSVAGGTASGECLELNDTTADNVSAGDLVMTHSVIDCEEPFKSGPSDALTTKDWFLAEETNAEAQVSLTAAGLPADGEDALLGAGKDMSAEDSFFDETDYIGAFGTQDWTDGWTFKPE